MYTNPYGQAGWSSGSSGRGRSSAEHSSIYGALPYSSLPTLEAPLVFEFSSFQPNILNCLVLSPDSRPIFRIDSASKPGYTVFKDKNNVTVATIKWRDSSPSVEINGLFERIKAGKWLALAPDNSQRSMLVHGYHFSWVPRRNTVNLYDSNQTRLARLERKPDSVTLEMLPNGLALNIMVPCIVAAALLMSGNNID